MCTVAAALSHGIKGEASLIAPTVLQMGWLIMGTTTAAH